MKRILALPVTAALLAAAAVLAAAPASASAPRHIRPASTQNGIITCNRAGGQCFSANGTNGNDVFSKSFTRNNAEFMTWQPIADCTHGGQLSDFVQSVGFHGDTTNCPFKPGLGLNATYAGFQIDYAKNDHTGACYNQNPADTFFLVQDTSANCDGDPGHDWVLDFADSADLNAAVNVRASDSLGSGAPEVACFAGVNSAVSIQTVQGCSAANQFLTLTP